MTTLEALLEGTPKFDQRAYSSLSVGRTCSYQLMGASDQCIESLEDEYGVDGAPLNVPPMIRLDWVATVILIKDRHRRRLAHIKRYGSSEGGRKVSFKSLDEYPYLHPAAMNVRTHREHSWPDMDVLAERIVQHDRERAVRRWWLREVRLTAATEVYNPVSALNRRMSDKHEADLAEKFGGRVSPGSGNQWNRPMDVRQSRFAMSVAFAMEGKSTLGKSIGVTRAMWDKAVEQAGGERPLLALRWYADDRLTGVDIDLIVTEAEDFAELLEMSQAHETLERIRTRLRSGKSFGLGEDIQAILDGRE